LEKFVAKGVKVQSESLGADSCAVMYAQHLAVFASSSFSEALSLFNPKPVTLYDPMGGEIGCRKHGFKTHCPHGERIKYCVTGIDEFRTVRQKIDWVRTCPHGNVWRDGMTCFQ
jgi:hypothetical protein